MAMEGELRPKMVATWEEMDEARIPVPFRDQCAHILIPLNKCRLDNYFLPWRCVDERHQYERCEYELFLWRMRRLQRLREEQKQKAGVAIPVPQPLPM